jgi:hypothetical protein
MLKPLLRAHRRWNSKTQIIPPMLRLPGPRFWGVLCMDGQDSVQGLTRPCPGAISSQGSQQRGQPIPDLDMNKEKPR